MLSFVGQRLICESVELSRYVALKAKVKFKLVCLHGGVLPVQDFACEIG